MEYPPPIPKPAPGRHRYNSGMGDTVIIFGLKKRRSAVAGQIVCNLAPKWDLTQT
jgi:hypothetical protein